MTNVAEAGLLGIALHPNFEAEPWVYLYYSAQDHNRIVRVLADGNRGTTTEPILEGLPTQSYHNGGDITFGPDARLYAVLGEAHDPERAQDQDDIGGKTLRLDPDGGTPEDNPIGAGSPVYSMGHRNSFGICLDPSTGTPWETENGPTGHDELNRIEAGGNYGWPVVSGPGGEPEFIDPALDFPDTIVPTGCAVYTEKFLGPQADGALFFGDFGGNLHRVVLSDDRREVASHKVVVSGLPGITDVAMGPDGRLYLATTESILRLPTEVAGPSPSPEASPAPAPGIPTVAAGEEDEGSALPWIIVGVLGAGAFAVTLLILRRARR